MEVVRPDYLLEDVITEPPDTLYRMDDRGVRFYYTLDSRLNPTFYGSSTTIKSLVTPTPRPIIDKEIQMGTEAFRAYRDNRAAFGTFWHVLAAELTEFGSYNLDNLDGRIKNYADAKPEITHTDGWHEDAWKGLLSWIRTMNQYAIKPLAIEVPLAHPGGVAGTIDLVCEMNAKKYTDKTDPADRQRITAIIDWKTGYIFPDHAIQLELNKMIWEHNYPDIKIDALYNWTWKDWRTKPTYELRNQTGSDEADLIKHYMHIWRTKHYRKPRNIKTAGGQITVGGDTSGFYREMPIEQYVKEKHEKQMELL